ncbi:hypothetical protein ACI01nite_00070 [Acetobacter cibinongensis]|uniref:Uncharacterized protein n=1 Tax=Acetobacter cibinongensis TaxID=146475 RepID=A0A0D6N7H5_9PROT|nr:hypothetical protein Abci_030_007 [Acetobacter cibinongensis]GBQ15962.1 hypothetical protein AA0482_1381 [Acetobacter cibinongensis NRIC 0482]GEL57405.1 hypothetical protein ACI01nite_00070 [Acetobacter cibinongensis]
MGSANGIIDDAETIQDNLGAYFDHIRAVCPDTNDQCVRRSLLIKQDFSTASDRNDGIIVVWRITLGSYAEGVIAAVN